MTWSVATFDRAKRLVWRSAPMAEAWARTQFRSLTSQGLPGYRSAAPFVALLDGDRVVLAGLERGQS